MRRRSFALLAVLATATIFAQSQTYTFTTLDYPGAKQTNPNKINAAGVLTLRTLQDSNKLLASLLEEQTILAKQQREATTNSINADIQRQANLAANITQVTGTLTNSLQTFRMP